MPVVHYIKLISLHILFLPLLFPNSAIAQDIVELQRIEGAIEIDGISDEEAWHSITPYPLTMNNPIFRGEPTEMTEIKIGYDDNFIYAAGKFYDSDPSGVRKYSYERDGSGPGDDHFAVILDTYNDNETALGFFTTPAGIRNDVAIFNDAETSGPPPWNQSWNTFWDVKVINNGDGWFAEMRIPFSSLRFQDENGKIIMGLITWRYIARKNETVSYPAIPPKWDWGNFKPSVAQDISLEGIYSRTPLYVTPYGLGGVGHSNTLNDAEDEYLFDNDPTNEIGIDIKQSITSNLTLDATVNTDFAQVEVDDEQINLTRFSLFFPEKRLFS